MRDGEVLGAPPEIVLQPFPLRNVANHQRETAQLARVVPQRREHDVRFEGMPLRRSRSPSDSSRPSDSAAMRSAAGAPSSQSASR